MDPRHHLYVHVPFCRLVCAYCDFVTVAGRRADIPRYVDDLLIELGGRPAPGRLESIYFGGGTPSLLPAEAVARIVQRAIGRWGHEPSEVTIEANPGRRERPDWVALRAAGVNRLSLGVQSLRDAELRTLARGHEAVEAVETYRGARAAGFDNIGLDLIYGIPGQTAAAFRAGLEEAIALAPEHLSLYALSLPVTPDEWSAPPRGGALRWRRRMAAAQDDGLAAEHYELAQDLLERAGYVHYELSSWSLPGRESVHNRGYWERRPYTGIGAGAHSFDGAARSWNTRDLDRYLAAVEARRSPVEGRELLEEPTRAFEAVALGLRLVSGLSRSDFAAEFGADPVDRYAEAIGETRLLELVEVAGGTVRLTRRGRLFATDALIAFAP